MAPQLADNTIAAPRPHDSRACFAGIAAASVNLCVRTGASEEAHAGDAARRYLGHEQIAGGIAEDAVGAVQRRAAAADRRAVGREGAEARHLVGDFGRCWTARPTSSASSAPSSS